MKEDSPQNDVEFQGFNEDVSPVSLIWATPNGDQLIADMARVSNSKAQPGDPADRLISFLLRNHHWSPFEMVNMCVEIHTERDISAQILRHSKEFRFQEFSTRYAEVEDLRYGTECRWQDPKNRQSSQTYDDMCIDGTPREIDNLDATLSYFDAVVNETRERSLEAYRELLSRGVAKECARRILPIGLMPTRMYINSNVRGWVHYLAERTKPGVQKEHREIALALKAVFDATFPMVASALRTIEKERQKRERYADVLEGWVHDSKTTGMAPSPADFVSFLLDECASK